MKTYALILVLLLCPFLSSHADIYNGYTKEKAHLKKGLKALETQLITSMDEKSAKQLNRKLKKLRKHYEAVRINYEATENLLAEIKRIDPTLYHEVSTVVNAEGSLTHVFVKIMARSTDKFMTHASLDYSLTGYTNIGHWDQNPNVHASEYGVYTVSVVIGNTPDKLTAMAHEFGHVLYQVKNLKSYITYYKDEYNQNSISKFGLGHDPIDPGHAFIKSIENEFRSKYRKYLKPSRSNQELLAIEPAP